ncbi:MAG TPA: hypothetical protein VM513_21005 [Kofleriaceae bacterium]|nr:hypothetical protein [Kofleriaceae bacterium]
MRASVGCLMALVACGSPPPAQAPSSSGAITNVSPPPTAPPPAGTPIPTGTKVGTEHAIVVENVARDGSWIAICQARSDTDGDGKIEINLGYHGDVYGDALSPFLVRHDGDGEPIEQLVSVHRDRWVVAMRGGKLAVFDAREGTWQELPQADLRDDGIPLGPHRAASVANAGAHVVYFKDDQTMIVRELATGIEQVVVVPGVKLWRVEVEPLGHWAKVYAIRKDTDGDGKLSWPSVRTSLSARGCRGPIMSYSTGGWDGDRPDELWLEVTTATIVAKRGNDPADPAEDAELGTVGDRRILAVDAAGKKLLAPGPPDRRALPDGPLEWVDAPADKPK